MKPTEFLIGAKEFFSVIVPGAVFLLIMTLGTDGAFGVSIAGIGAIIFAVGAYLFGSIAAAMGSVLDLAVDAVLENPRYQRIDSDLRKRGETARQLRDEVARSCSYQCLQSDTETLKSFWVSYLRLHCPVGAADLERLEATHKLFRSLTAVFLVLWIMNLLGLYPLSPVVQPWLGFGAAMSLVLYAGGRRISLAAVFRWAGACQIPGPHRATNKGD